MSITEHVEPDLDPTTRLSPGQLTRLVIVRELISADVKDVEEMTALGEFIEAGRAVAAPPTPLRGIPVASETPLFDGTKAARQ